MWAGDSARENEPMHERTNPTPPKPARKPAHRGSLPTKTKRVDEEPLDDAAPSVQMIEPKHRRSDFPLRYGR